MTKVPGTFHRDCRNESYVERIVYHSETGLGSGFVIPHFCWPVRETKM